MGLGGRIEKRCMKYRPSTLHGGEDYPKLSKLFLAISELDKGFNEMKIDRVAGSSATGRRGVC